MRIVKNLVARWSEKLKRYVIEEAQVFEHSGPVAYAFGGGGGGGEVVPTGPFGPQIPFVMALFQEAAKLFQQGPPQFPQFNTVAQPGQDLLQSQQNIGDIVAGNQGTSQTAIDTALGAATSAGQNPVSNVANPLGGNLQQGLLQLLQGGSNPLVQAGARTLPGAAGAINTATAGAQGAQPGFDPSGAPQLGPAGIDINPTLQANLGGSGLNPFIADTVSAATRGLVNNFQRNVIPSIGDAAGQAGQAGGTRQGIAEGIAAGDLQQNVTDITAQLFAQGFDRNIGVQQNALAQIGGAQGLQGQFGLAAGGLNEQIRNAILGQALQGADLSQTGLGTGLGLGQSSLSTGTSQIGNLLQAGNAQGLSQLFGGLGLLPGLQGSQLAQQGALNQSGLQQLGLDQTNIDADIQRFFFNEFAPFNALAQFQNFIGGSFGSSVGGNPNNLGFEGIDSNLFPNDPNQRNPDAFGGSGKGGTSGDAFGGSGKGAAPGVTPGGPASPPLPQPPLTLG